MTCNCFGGAERLFVEIRNPTCLVEFHQDHTSVDNAFIPTGQIAVATRSLDSFDKAKNGMSLI